jgi:hypothetical protein
MPFRPKLPPALAALTLACLHAGLACPRALADCPVPPSYTHSTSVVDGDLRITLATDRATYFVRDPVAMFLLFENTGGSTVTIPNPSSITPLYDFDIVPESCDVPGPPDCLELFHDPTIVHFFGAPIDVAPGECLSYAASWDGVPSSGTARAGSFVVRAGMTSGAGRLFLPPGGIRLPFAIQDVLVPARPTTWGRLKSIYR